MTEANCNTKKCSKCKEEKSLDSFHRMSSGSSTGRVPRCKPCVAIAYSGQRQSRLEKAKERYWKDPEKIKSYARNRYANNRESLRVQLNEYSKSDRGRETARIRRQRPDKIVNSRIRLSLWKHLNETRNGRKIWSILGYTKNDLVSHLERQFTDGMSWANYGKWHIDHIRPMKNFSIASIDDPQVRIAWGLPNLRPLWAKENMTKSGKQTHLI